jgi:hypothetical protein
VSLFFVGCHVPFSTFAISGKSAKRKRRLSTNRPFPPTTYAGRESTGIVGWHAQQIKGSRTGEPLEFTIDNEYVC